MKSEFSRQFPKNTQILNFIKIRPVEAQLFLADGRKDVHKECNSSSSQFCALVYDRSFVLAAAKVHSGLWYLRRGRRKVIRTAVFSVEGEMPPLHKITIVHTSSVAASTVSVQTLHRFNGVVTTQALP